MGKRVLIVVGVAVALGLVVWWRGYPPRPRASGREAPPAESARFVGVQACAKCHPAEEARWRDSHHALAMQVADARSVLGDFEGARFHYHGVVSTFYREDGKFRVRTDGPDGTLRDYDIAYTFGVYPLQQYLVAFPGGRYQALTIGWDSRPLQEGGHRWFHLHPDEVVLHNDPLHWTGPYQNWNFMCAECHSTNLKKGYAPSTDTYQTTFSEINVSCEACHGPGSAHVAWAEGAGAGHGQEAVSAHGLVVTLKETPPPTWDFDNQRGIAKRNPPRTSHIEFETCARCHARRSVVSEDYVWGEPLLNTHRPALLEEGLYYADGQIKDEVYEYGSFLQSKMYREGVTCSDCHDPHSLRVPVPIDAVCARCHLRERFNTPSHHFHQSGSRGASCVACHMPSQTYMVIDPRHDHSFRVPRPDLSAKTGAPNACNLCHRTRSAAWAAATSAKWWGLGRAPAASTATNGEALGAGRAGLPGAEGLLAQLAENPAQPTIARATAVALLGGYAGPTVVSALGRALEDPDPLVRLGAVGAADALPSASRVALIAPLLKDPLRTVRVDAARALASEEGRGGLSTEQATALAAALAEYRSAQLANADRAEAHLNLGTLQLERGELGPAEQEYRTALRLNPWSAPSYLSLAEVYSHQGREAEGERVLREGLRRAATDPGLPQALGLLLVRQRRVPEALSFLARSAELAPDQPHFAYVYAVALHSTGQAERALSILRGAHQAHPGDAEILLALVTMNRDGGNLGQALGYARELAKLLPWDPRAQQALAQLEADRPRGGAGDTVQKR